MGQFRNHPGVRNAVLACLVGLADVVGLARVLTAAPPLGRGARPAPLPLSTREAGVCLPRAVPAAAVDAAVTSALALPANIRAHLEADMRALLGVYRALCEPRVRANASRNPTLPMAGARSWVELLSASVALRGVIASPPPPADSPFLLPPHASFGFGSPLDALQRCFSQPTATASLDLSSTAAAVVTVPAFRASASREPSPPRAANGAEDRIAGDPVEEATRASALAHVRLLRMAHFTGESCGLMWLPVAARTCLIDFCASPSSAALHVDDFSAPSLFPYKTAPPSTAVPRNISGIILSSGFEAAPEAYALIETQLELLIGLKLSEFAGAAQLLRVGLLELICWLAAAVLNDVAPVESRRGSESLARRVQRYARLPAVVRRVLRAIARLIKSAACDYSPVFLYDENPLRVAPSLWPILVRLLAVAFPDAAIVTGCCDVIRELVDRMEDRLRDPEADAQPRLGIKSPRPQSFWGTQYFWAVPGSIEAVTDTLVFWSGEDDALGVIRDTLIAGYLEGTEDTIDALASAAAGNDDALESITYCLSNVLGDAGATINHRRDLLTSPPLLHSVLYILQRVRSQGHGDKCHFCGLSLFASRSEMLRSSQTRRACWAKPSESPPSFERSLPRSKTAAS